MASWVHADNLSVSFKKATASTRPPPLGTASRETLWAIRRLTFGPMLPFLSWLRRHQRLDRDDLAYQRVRTGLLAARLAAKGDEVPAQAGGQLTEQLAGGRRGL